MSIHITDAMYIIVMPYMTAYIPLWCHKFNCSAIHANVMPWIVTPMKNPYTYAENIDATFIYENQASQGGGKLKEVEPNP